MTPQVSNYSEKFFEYVRHFTTLSTGSILVQMAFLEKVFPKPQWRAFVITSLAGFTLSVIASVVTYTIFLTREKGKAQPPNAQPIDAQVALPWMLSPKQRP